MYRYRYVLISFVGSLGISLAPVVRQMYGWDIPEEICWYQSSGQRWNLEWEWLTLFGWLILGELYCIFVLFSVIWHLRRTMVDSNKTLEFQSFGRVSAQQTRVNRILRKIAIRVVRSQCTLVSRLVPKVTLAYQLLVSRRSTH